jgi:hypothetical protein
MSIRLAMRAVKRLVEGSVTELGGRLTLHAGMRFVVDSKLHFVPRATVHLALHSAMPGELNSVATLVSRSAVKRVPQPDLLASLPSNSRPRSSGRLVKSLRHESSAYHTKKSSFAANSYGDVSLFNSRDLWVVKNPKRKVKPYCRDLKEGYLALLLVGFVASRNPR